MLPFTVCPVGDTGLLVSFEQRIAQSVGAAVAALNARVAAAAIPGVVETVPAFASLLIFYDPLVTEYDAVAAAVQKLAQVPDSDTAAGEGRLVEIPVCYGGTFGPDLPFVAEHAGLTEKRSWSCTPGGSTVFICWAFCRAFPIWAGWMSGSLPRVWPRRALRSRQALSASAVSRRAFTPSPARAAGS